MKKLLLFFIAIFLWFTFSPTDTFAHGGTCWVCGDKDYEDEDFLCDDCDLCENCRYNEYVHCPECNECYGESGKLCEHCNLCENCSALANHCQECEGCVEDVGEICYGCGMCRDCQDEYHFHCRLCGDCDSGEGCYECCDICKSCAYEWNVHCYECGGCLEDGFEMCDKCSLCFDCADENGRHCAACSGDFDFDECCTLCHCCPSCNQSLGYHCYACDACIEDAGEICDECHMCSGCAFENFTHCADCEECKPMSVCEDCGYCNACAIVELKHCEACHKCVEDEICADCNLCEDCAKSFNLHCKKCGLNHIEDGGCEECEACQDCIDDEGLHCYECNACPSEEELCSECGYCIECAVNNYLHCELCEECFESDGGVCEDCHFCDECGVSEGTHCPECFEHKDLCDECGYCFDCAEDEGYHCPECGECKADDMCESGGEHCRECCEQNDWICEECGICVEAEGSEKCEYCDLCLECCATASEEKGCSHNVCVESTEWADHYCDKHDMCKNDCPCRFDVGEHTHQFDPQTHICSVCKMKEISAPEIFKNPKDVKCEVRDPEKDSPAEKTISFSVGAMGEGLSYTWYTCNDGNRNTVMIDSDRDDDEMFVAGAGTEKLTISAPTDGCSVTNYYYCVVTNEHGSVESEKARAVMSHGVSWKDYTHLSADDQMKVDIKSVTVVTGADNKSTTYKYSDYHYQVCPADGCGRYVGTTALHKYGEWTVAIPPTEEGNGAQYKECEECGAKLWKQLDKTAVTGMPYITAQPQNVTAMVPNFKAVEDGWEDYVRPTVSFSVQAAGEGNLQYEWHEEYTTSGGQLISRKIYEDDFVSGYNTNNITIYVPEEGCDYYTDGESRIFCVVRNAKGVATSSKARLAIKHNYHVVSIDNVNYREAPFKSDVKNVSVMIDGKLTTVMQSDYHYNICDGCMKYEGEKRVHTYGDWKLHDKPTASAKGSMYQECSGCGAKFWKDILPNRDVVFVKNPKESVNVKASAYNSETKTFDVNTVKISVEALKINPTDEVTYHWEIYTNDYRVLKDNTTKPETLVSGANTTTLIVAAPIDRCGNTTGYRCVAENKTTGSTTYSSTCWVYVQHNMKWMPASQFSYKLYSKNGDYFMDAKYYDRVMVDDHTHHYVCANRDCHEYKASNLNKSHNFNSTPYEILSPATAKSSTLCRYTCSMCGKTEEKTVGGYLSTAAVTADAYAAPVDILQVDEIGEYGVVRGTVLSGRLSDNPSAGLAIVYPDGTVDKRTIPCYLSEESGYKGKPFAFYQYYIFGAPSELKPRFASLPKGTLLTNDPSQIKHANIALGKMHIRSAVEPYVGEKDIYFKIDDQWLKSNIMELASVTKEGNFYDAIGVEVLLEKEILMYAGQVVPVGLKNGSTYVQLGTFTMTDCNVPAPEMWLITKDGQKVDFRREYSITTQSLLPSGSTDGRITWSGNTITIFEGTEIQSLHIGEDKPYTVLVGNNVKIEDNSSKGYGGIYAAGPLTISAWEGADVSIRSKRGIAIEAASLVLNDERQRKWHLDCAGSTHAIKADDGFLVNPGLDAHLLAKTGEMAVAPFVNKSKHGYFSGSFVADVRWSRPIIMNTYDSKTKTECFYDYNDESLVNEFDIHISPNIIMRNEDLFDGMLKEPFHVHSYKGNLSFNQTATVMTIKDFTFSDTHKDAGDPMFEFTPTLLDTVYVRVEGDNVIETSTICAAVLSINSNVKLIGEGTLRVNAEQSNGIVIGDKGSLTVDDHVTLVVNCSTDRYAITSAAGSTAGTSRLVIGEKATLDTYSKGIAYLGDVDIRGNGEPENVEDCIFFAGEVRTPQRIIYPGAWAYAYNVDGDGLMHFANDGLYDEHRFVVGDHAPIRMGDMWIPTYDASLNKALGDGIQFTLTQDGCTGSGSYDPATQTLYLDNVTSCGNNYGSALQVSGGEVTVVMSGDCEFTSTAAVPITVSKYASVTFTSEDSETPANMKVSLIDAGNNTGIRVNGTVTFRDLSVTMDEFCAIRSRADRCLFIENSSVDFGFQAFIDGVKVSLDGVEFEDSQMKYDNHKETVVNTSSKAPINGDFKIVLKDENEAPTELPIVEALPSADTDKGTFTIRGERVYDNYRGLVIQNGKKVLKK